MSRSPAVEEQIQRWVDRLEKTFDRLVRCEVMIEQPHRHNRKGNTFRVRVELTVPGDTLVVSRDTGLDHTHENVYVALSDSFRAARRRLRHFAQRLLAHAA
jgi:ribosome-associated translation inhibitor RaiA